MNKVNEIARRTLFYFLIILPVAALPIFSSPFEMFKTASSGILVSFLAIYFLYKFNKEEINIPNKIMIAFFATSFVSNLFSNNLIESFLSNYPRFIEGEIINHLLLVFLVILLNSYEKIDILKIQFYSSIPVSIIALIETFSSNQRIHASFSQANFLGIFLAITLINLITNKKLVIDKYKMFYDLYLLVILFLLIKSASITSIIALVITFLYLFFKKEIVVNYKKTSLFILCFIFLVYLSGNILLPKVKDIYFQLKDRNQTTISDSFLIRNALWETTLNLTRANFKSIFLGYGSNTFITEFEKSRNPKLNSYSEYYLFFDKPHNYYLELAFSQGIFVLLIFLYLLYSSINKNTESSKYILLISVFIFFNWLDWYLKIFLFILISLNLPNLEIKNSKYKLILIIFSFILGIYFSAVLISDFFFKSGRYNTASSINPINKVYLIKSGIINSDFFYQQNNPLILVEGLKFYKNDELVNYIKFLEKEFPTNLPIKLHINSN